MWEITRREPGIFLVSVAFMPLAVFCTIGMFFALAGFFAGLETFYFLSFDEDRHYIFTPPQEARWWSKVVMFLFVTPPRIFLGITKPAIVGTHEIFTDAPYRKPDFSLPAVPWTQVRENV